MLLAYALDVRDQRGLGRAWQHRAAIPSPLAVDGEGCQERGDVGRSHLSRVALVVEEDVSLDPVDVGLLRAAAVVSGPDNIAHAVEKAAFWRRGRTGFMDGEHGTGSALPRGGIRDVAAGRKANHAHAFEIPFCS